MFFHFNVNLVEIKNLNPKNNNEKKYTFNNYPVNNHNDRVFTGWIH